MSSILLEALKKAQEEKKQAALSEDSLQKDLAPQDSQITEEDLSLLLNASSKKSVGLHKGEPLSNAQKISQNKSELDGNSEANVQANEVMLSELTLTESGEQGDLEPDPIEEKFLSEIDDPSGSDGIKKDVESKEALNGLDSGLNLTLATDASPLISEDETQAIEAIQTVKDSGADAISLIQENEDGLDADQKTSLQGSDTLLETAQDSDEPVTAQVMELLDEVQEKPETQPSANIGSEEALHSIKSAQEKQEEKVLSSEVESKELEKEPPSKEDNQSVQVSQESAEQPKKPVRNKQEKERENSQQTDDSYDWSLSQIPGFDVNSAQSAAKGEETSVQTETGKANDSKHWSCGCS